MFWIASRRRAERGDGRRAAAGGGWLLRLYRRAYRLDRWFERRFTALGRLVIGSMVVAALFSLNVHRAQTYKLSTLLVALVGTSYLLSRGRRRGLAVERALPGFATVDEPFEYALRLRVDGPHDERSLWLHDRLSDAWPDAAQMSTAGRRRPARYRLWLQRMQRLRGAQVAPVEASRVPVGERAEVRLTLRPLRRGYLNFEALDIGRPDPLGLARAIKRIELPGRLLVLPRRYPVRNQLIPGGGGRRGGGGGVGQGIGQSEEFMSLREYRPGDPLRHIHWKAWARIGEPIVKEYHEEADARVVLMLDHYDVSSGEPAFEALVDAASSLAVQALADGAVVELVLADRSVEAGARDGTTGDALLAALATVDGAPGALQAGAVARIEAARHRLRGILCLLAGWDLRHQQLLARLRATGLPVRAVAVCADDAAAAAAAAGPGQVLAATAGDLARALGPGSTS